MIEPTPIPPLATSRVVTSVFEQILAAVNSGALKPGQRISDAELAESFGVSRTPVREALQRLREIGIIEASASRFTRVADVTPRQMVEALIVWVALYDALLDEVVPVADETAVAELQRHHDDFLVAMKSRDGDALATATFHFYNVLAQRSTNATLQRSITGVVHIVRLGSLYLSDFFDIEALGDAQQLLINAVRDHDVAAAHDSMRIIDGIKIPSS